VDTSTNPSSIEQEAREAARHYSDVNEACPYPFHSTEGQVFRAAFAAAQASERLNKENRQ
jgi:hypothetical protein